MTLIAVVPKKRLKVSDYTKIKVKTFFTLQRCVKDN